MLNVSITFDEETKLDAIDLLGDLRISDGHSTIMIATTFLDSWLVALIEAYDQTRTAGHVKVEVPEEHFFLQIDVGVSGLIAISDGKSTLQPQSRDAFYRALRAASEYFLKVVVVLPGSERNTLVETIKMFVSPGLPDSERN
jgi:hypothetical protein